MLLTEWCRNSISIVQNTRNRHPIAHPGGQGMRCLDSFVSSKSNLWSAFLIVQGSFWVHAQPMRFDVALWHQFSLATTHTQRDPCCTAVLNIVMYLTVLERHSILLLNYANKCNRACRPGGLYWNNYPSVLYHHSNSLTSGDEGGISITRMSS